MPKLDLICKKKNHIASMIADMKRGEKVVARVGGKTISNKGDEIAFQQRRLAELEWAETPGRTDTQIRARIAAYEAELPADALACKYGYVAALPMGHVEKIAAIELLELALGTHPALGVK